MIREETKAEKVRIKADIRILKFQERIKENTKNRLLRECKRIIDEEE